MKLLNKTGLEHLINKIKEMISKKADTEYVDSKVKTDVPANAKFTDTITTVNGKTGAIFKSDIEALDISVGWERLVNKPDVAVKKDIDDIEIGGRNLIQNYKSVDGWANNSGGVSGGVPYRTTDYIELEPGKDYMYQLWNPDKISTWWTAVYYDENNIYLGGYTSRYITSEYTVERINTNKYANAKKVRITYTEHEGKKQKLERGNKMTDWTPAPEDSVAYLDDRVRTNVPPNAKFTDTKTWSGITGKPSTFTPSSHTHSTAQITDINQSLRTTDKVQFGQVGVGTATPNFPVDVVGDVRIREDSGLKLGGSGSNDDGFELTYDKTTKSVNFNFK